MDRQTYKIMKQLLITLVTIMIAYSGIGQFTVSANKRFILKDSRPFFWLGDTAWELFHVLNREEADMYLKKRSSQGFTVIQAVVLSEYDGLHTPNANGDLPLRNDDPTKPIEAYFKHVDYIIDKAASYHLNIALLPTWGDKVYLDRWGKGPEIFNETNAGVYAAWLARRYKNKKNIIWVLGGDRNPRGDADIKIWQAMGTAIMKETANKALITYHSQPNNTGSAEWFHNDSWLSFNMLQTGHCRETALYEKIETVYNLKPVKPVLDGEPIYEDHPVCFNEKELGTSNAFDVRRSAYLSLFAGSFGHTYGCHDVWQMYSTKRPGINGPHVYWQEALDLPGAAQMKHVRKLMEAFPMLERIPDQSLIKENKYGPASRIQATRGDDYLMVYSSAGDPFTLNLGVISGQELNGYWYDPRTGNKTKVQALTNSGTKVFKPLSNSQGQDWILVLFDSRKKYNVLSK